MTIQETILCVMRSVGAIRKGQTNKFDHYDFRGIDDLYNVLGPAFAEHGMFVMPEVLSCDIDTLTTTKGVTMQRAVVKVRYHFIAEDGSNIWAMSVGEGADRGDKAVNKAMTSAFKTVLFQTLCIPTKEQSDSEFDSPELVEPEAPPHATVPPQPAEPQVDVWGRLEDFTRGLLTTAGRDENEWKQLLVDALRSLDAQTPGGSPADGGNCKGVVFHQMQQDTKFLHGLKAALGECVGGGDDATGDLFVEGSA